MRVTFDTNTLDPITQPDFAGSLRADCSAIHRALESRRVVGFFCETIATVEGGGSSRRIPLRPDIVARLNRALNLGMRILRAPRIGNGCIEGPEGDLYVKEADDTARSIRLERYEAIATAIESRGLGYAHMLRVKKTAAARDRAVAERADGDSVAAHYGYGNDLFCTEDRARKAGRRSSCIQCSATGFAARMESISSASLSWPSGCPSRPYDHSSRRPCRRFVVD